MPQLVVNKFCRSKVKPCKYYRFKRGNRKCSLGRRIIDTTYKIALINNTLDNLINASWWKGKVYKMSKAWRQDVRSFATGTEESWSWHDNRWWFFDGLHEWGKYGQEWWRCETVWIKYSSW